MLMGSAEFDGLMGRTSQVNGLCMAARGVAMNMTLMRAHLEMAGLREEMDDEPESNGDKTDDKGEKKDEEKKDKPKRDPGDMLDGIPEWFVGPLLSDLVAHEVGHTIGLRHNFKGSTLFTVSEINSEAVKGKKTWSNSVMEYAPLNVRMESGDRQGDFGPIDIGPYDTWAIEYGYTTDDPKKVLARARAELPTPPTRTRGAGPLRPPLGPRSTRSSTPRSRCDSPASTGIG